MIRAAKLAHQIGIVKFEYFCLFTHILHIGALHRIGEYELTHLTALIAALFDAIFDA